MSSALLLFATGHCAVSNQMSIPHNKLPLPPLRPPKTTPDEGIGDEFEVEVAVDDDIEALLSSINS